MPPTDIRSAQVGSSTIKDFSVNAVSLDSPSASNEIYWDSPYYKKWLGYYKKIPELKQAIDSLAMWVAGKGYKTDPSTKVILEHISGWGEDTIDSILKNMISTKKINGDAFAEIIKENGILINLKPLAPDNIRIVVGKNGIIKRYEQINKDGNKKIFKPEEIFHISNCRTADEIHGVSVVESCEEVILMRNEAMTDWRKCLHRNIYPLKIVELDTDDPTKINAFITKWESSVKDRETIFIPKGSAGVSIPQVSMQNPESWIRYLENFFYQAVGVPKVILGGSQEFTEASSKIGYLTFEQVYMSEQRELEQDIWNQLGLKIEFERPVSLKEAVQESEAANTGQTGFQPNEMQTGVTRNE